MKVLSTFFQILLDVIVGLATYFSLHSFAPSWSHNAIVIITLIVTAIFAETLEVKLKK